MLCLTLLRVDVNTTSQDNLLGASKAAAPDVPLGGMHETQLGGMHDREKHQFQGCLTVYWKRYKINIRKYRKNVI